MTMRWLALAMAVLIVPVTVLPAAEAPRAAAILPKPDAVFDGVDGRVHHSWQVLVVRDKIAEVGPGLAAPAGSRTIDRSGDTLPPGMIEGHGHLFLHPYNETSWDDQVMRGPLALRTARAVAQARTTLLAGFTSERDLGTEGAGYADVGLRQAIDRGIVPGPRLSVATRAIVALGAYGPKGFEPGIDIPQGADEVSGVDQIVAAVRRQIAAGADWMKPYADYRWRPDEDSRPTFSLEEMKAAVVAAHDAGRPVAVHAATAEGLRRAIAAGVDTIELGNGGTPETFAAMAAKGIALRPPLAASDATSRYRGWNGSEPAPPGVQINRDSFRSALKAGVPMCMGGDVGLLPNDQNAREMTLMVAAGMAPAKVLIAATGGNARWLKLDGRLGAVGSGRLANLITVRGDPVADITAVRQVAFVMKGGIMERAP